MRSASDDGAVKKDFGVVRMTRAEALRLPNATYPYVNDPGYYIGELAVFHQLHCLVSRTAPGNFGFESHRTCLTGSPPTPFPRTNFG